MSKSLSLQKFYKTIEAEIRNYWQINTALIYSERWWSTIEEKKLPKRLTQYQGDDKRPFRSIDISPNEYLGNIPSVIQITRENSIIGFITSFEVYLYDIVKRIIYLDPTIIEESSMPFEAKDISNILGKKDFKEWFSAKVADKYMRNKTHLKMILKIQGLIKHHLKNSKNDLIEEWNKWTYLRNAIVHNGREVSEDLFNIWPAKFSRTCDSLKLTDADLIRVHYLAIELAKFIDSIIVTKFIGDEDAVLLVREIFIRYGTADPKILKKQINSILNHKLKSPLVDKALAYQRRTGLEPRGYVFSHYNFIE